MGLLNRDPAVTQMGEPALDAQRKWRPSIGSVGDAYDNALMECVIGLHKTECIRTNVSPDPGRAAHCATPNRAPQRV